MPSMIYKTGDEYVTKRDLQKLRVQLRLSRLATPTLAYEMRMSPSHVYALLAGRARMAHHILLAIRFVLLLHRTSMKKAAALTFEDERRPTSKDTYPDGSVY